MRAWVRMRFFLAYDKYIWRKKTTFNRYNTPLRIFLKSDKNECLHMICVQVPTKKNLQKKSLDWWGVLLYKKKNSTSTSFVVYPTTSTYKSE